MIYQSKQYIRFLRKSKNQHGVHSPFVYGLVTQCFYDKQKYGFYERIKAHRKALLQSKKYIEVKDFGAGSRIFSSNRRKVKAIAKHAGVSKKRQRLLARLVQYVEANNILELGTSVGLAAAAMASATSKGTIHTVEGCPETAKTASDYFKAFELDNITLHNTLFNPFFDTLSTEKFDIIYIDGNHKKEETIEYFNRAVPHSHNDTLFIMDDIYWSPAMTEAWETIKNHPSVTVSIDTFQWGLVSIRAEQHKEHFTIRV